MRYLDQKQPKRQSSKGIMGLGAKGKEDLLIRGWTMRRVTYQCERCGVTDWWTYRWFSPSVLCYTYVTEPGTDVTRSRKESTKAKPNIQEAAHVPRSSPWWTRHSKISQVVRNFHLLSKMGRCLQLLQASAGCAFVFGHRCSVFLDIISMF